ncbi:hypothetical protein HanIR_Chr11g0540371 [Helianthus annuus]|nr:hypothetical protein HanIR_Chr11g0540371 [Helianthus annuus]
MISVFIITIILLLDVLPPTSSIFFLLFEMLTDPCWCHLYIFFLNGLLKL